MENGAGAGQPEKPSETASAAQPESFSQNEPAESAETAQKVVDLQRSISFEDLVTDPQVLAEMAAARFVTPTDVQKKAIPTILAGTDAIVQAKTGSGKTLAFLLPYLARLKPSKESEPSAKGSRQRYFPTGLILTPTRELANQICNVFGQVTSRVAPTCVIGGVDVRQQLDQLSEDSRMVVGTPGRVLDLLRSRTISLAECRYFVLDEADEMLSMGFLEDVRAILSRLPDQRQGVFVSATITPRVDMLANSFLSKPEIVFVDSPYEDLPPIEHLYAEVGSDLLAKPSALCDLIEVYRPSSAIIFCNTKSDTHLVEVLLRRRGFDARRINSDLSQKQRDRIIQRIRARELQFLIATDIAARGLDIEQIDLVVNYSIPEQSELYIHRTGRTGRAGKSGRAISLVSPRDFGPFHHLTKVVDVKFGKLTPPREDEVADARLVHLYEALRTSSVELRERDLVVAKKLLNEIGEIAEPNEELQQAIAKLAKFMFEHLIQHEAQSLDEELAAAADETERPAEDRRRGRGERRDDGEDRRRERRHDDDREGGSGERQRSSRESSRDDRDSRRRAGPDERGRDERRQEDRRSDDRRRDERPRSSSRPEGAEPERREDRGRSSEQPAGDLAGREAAYRGSPQREVRIFIGQGTAHGMTDQLIIDLAKEFADIDPESLRMVNIREEYGFVDLTEADAAKLVEMLHGIEYNGSELTVEFAAVISDDRPRQDRGHGGDDRRYSGGRRESGGRGDSGGRGRRGPDRGRRGGGRSGRDRW